MEAIEKVLEKVTDFRKRKGLSHENIAIELGISQAAYTNLESMKSNLTVERLIKISEILEEPVYRFFEVSPQTINNQNNYDSSVGYNNLENFKDLYQDSRNTYEKLEKSYKKTVEILQEEVMFLKSLLKNQEKQTTT